MKESPKDFIDFLADHLSPVKPKKAGLELLILLAPQIVFLGFLLLRRADPDLSVILFWKLQILTISSILILISLNHLRKLPAGKTVN